MTTSLKPLAGAILLLLAACTEEPPVPEVPREQPPAWLEPIGDVAAQWRFRSMIHQWFEERGIPVRLDSRGRFVETRGRRRVFDVAEVALATARMPEEAWRDALDAQLGTLLEATESLADWTTPPWEEAEPKLRARLYPLTLVEAAGMRAGDVTHRTDLEGTLTCAALDREDAALLLPSDAPNEWGRSAEEVLEVAIANTREQLEGQLRIETRDLGEFGTLHELAGDSYYATLAVLWLDRWPELVGQHGAFVSVPWARSVLVLPFDDARAARGVPGLLAVSAEVVEEGQGSVAPGVWWRKPDGGFERIPIERQDGAPVAVPPPELAALLQRLLDR